MCLQDQSKESPVEIASISHAKFPFSRRNSFVDPDLRESNIQHVSFERYREDDLAD